MRAFLLIFAFSSHVCVTLQENIPGSTALDNFPLIDGHNDLAHNLYAKLRNQIANFSFDKNLSEDPIFGFSHCNSCHTDLVRMRQGKLGAQFWSVYVDCEPSNANITVSRSFEQVDVIKRLIFKYRDHLEFVTTADGIMNAFRNRKIASLMGLEGGHSIDNKMALLRQFYDLGVRYMTLTHTCSLPWADSSLVDAASASPISNLTEFGKKIVLEMNRLGMMVDLSHVSYHVMSQALDISKAPVIFSHSSAYSVYPHHRNVKDDILLKVKRNGGVVMVNFYSDFVAKANATIIDVINHINRIVDVAGIDHVGIGGDYDGVERVPKGLEDVSKYPKLFDLLRQYDANRWSIQNLEKLAGMNLYRVFKRVEQMKNMLLVQEPDETLIPAEDLRKFSENSSLRFSSKIISFFTVILLLLF